ncbi:hypothetical protein BV898_06864 [Hypsibius exemplaris]|uniref:CUB domain-containing protein n=1 Tax=Hypsibius exemplaris TaxID=2072580 RepID=A0A1W0WUX8_HYPEX|nr:hypothetical protein BV898_06864 [Hypsibius exemplaris]
MSFHRKLTEFLTLIVLVAAAVKGQTTNTLSVSPTVCVDVALPTNESLQGSSVLGPVDPSSDITSRSPREVRADEPTGSSITGSPTPCVNSSGTVADPSTTSSTPFSLPQSNDTSSTTAATTALQDSQSEATTYGATSFPTTVVQDTTLTTVLLSEATTAVATTTSLRPSTGPPRQCGGHHRFTLNSLEFDLFSSGFPAQSVAQQIRPACVWTFDSAGIDYYDIHVIVVDVFNMSAGSPPRADCAQTDRLELVTPTGTSIGVLCGPGQSVKPIAKMRHEFRVNALRVGSGPIPGFHIRLIARPIYELKCGSDGFELILPLARLDIPGRYPYENYQLQDGGCGATNNGSALRISSGYSQCGTSFSGSALGFVNTVVMVPKMIRNGRPRPVRRLPFACKNTCSEQVVSQSYNLFPGTHSRSRRSVKEDTARGRSVRAVRAEGAIAIFTNMTLIEGGFNFGNNYFRINVYDNDEFHPAGQLHTWRPNVVYFDVNAPRAPSNVIVAARDCWISTSRDPAHPLHYREGNRQDQCGGGYNDERYRRSSSYGWAGGNVPIEADRFLFLYEGCPYTEDPVERFPSAGNSDRFAIGSVELEPNTANTHYIHCTVRMCSATDPVDAARCDKTCLTPRFRFPTGPGSIAGVVKDALRGRPLSAVQVTAAQTNNGIALQEVTDVKGNYRLLGAPPGSGYTVKFEAEGYRTAVVENVTVAPGEELVLETLLYINDLINGTGNVSGVISNAVTGRGEAAVLVTFRKGINSGVAGQVIDRTSSDVNGTYSSTLETGHYTVQLSKPGFADSFLTVVVLGGHHRDQQNAVVSPLFPRGQTRVVLTWGEFPRDLDSHMSGPLNGSGNDRFHIYFGTRGASGLSPMTFLDWDDTTSYGPETITIERQARAELGVYRYLVHDFSNAGSMNSSALANSGAKVTLLRGNGTSQVYNVPNAEGTLWTVFELSGDRVTLINTMSYANNAGNIRLDSGDADLFKNLPPKVLNNRP